LQLCLNVDKLADKNDKTTLVKVLGCSDEASLESALRGIAEAALCEYLEMLLGKQVPTKAAEAQERRLYHLIMRFFDGRFPRESEITSMFQLTERASRTLLRNTRTKYHYALEPNLRATIGTLLSTAERESANGDYQITIQSMTIIEELKRTVSTIAPTLKQVKRLRDAAGIYVFPVDTYRRLCDHYGVELPQPQPAKHAR